MAMLTIRARRFIKRTCRNLDINGQKIGFDRSKVVCFNCHKNGHFKRECTAPKNQENRGSEYGRKSVPVENPTKNDFIAQDRIGRYDWSYQAEEEHLTNFALMALTSLGSYSNSDSENLEKADKERDELKLTLEKYQNSYKSLNTLLESQVSDKDKTGLGYKAASPVIENFVNSSKMIENQVNVRSRSDKEYHAVLPAYTGNYIPPKPDLMFIDEQVESESVDVVSTISSSAVKTIESKVKHVDVKNKGVETKPVRKNTFSPPIIEDWNSDDESKVEFEPKVEVKTVRPCIDKIKFVKTAREKVKKAHDRKNAILLSMKIMMVDLFPLEMVNVEYLEKLLDESQVLLRVLRKDNIYSVDLKSVVPTGGLTCLFAKAITGIKREFSVARTPQQNGVAETKNKTLIEDVRTMLVDSKLPTTFWVEAINTACYVLNKALVIKPHNKTPCELIRGRPPLIDFMKPFGCHVTILNTKDYLGKFDEKAIDGFLVGYSVVNWLFDINSLISMNYVPVVAGFQTNGIAGTKDNIVVDNGGQDTRSEFEGPLQQERQTKHINSTNIFNTVSSPVSTARLSFVNIASPSPINAIGTPASTDVFEEHPFERFSPFKNEFSLPRVPIVTLINDTGIFSNAYDDDAMEEEVDINNVVSSYTIPDALLTKFLKDHPKDQVIVFHSKTKHIEIRHHFIKDSYEKKLIQEMLYGYFVVKTGNSSLNNVGKRKTKRKVTKISQSSGPTNLVADETVYKEWEDIMERAATTASSLEVEQDSEKPSESEGFKQIIDFLNAKPIIYALTIQALVDKQKVIIMEESIRRDLKFDDAEGTACLPNDTIFAELARMSSTMASAIICLANNQKFKFSKYILDNMVKHLEGGVKFLMFLRFLQVFLDKQVEGMAKNKKIYVISSHTKNIFSNMRRQGHGFFRNVTPLFETMMVTTQEEVGEGSGLHTDSHHTPTNLEPSLSKSQKKIKPKRKQSQTAEVHSSSSEIPVEESILTPSNDLLPSGEDSIQLNELMIFCTSLQQQVLDLEEPKIAQPKEIAKLKKRVKKLENRRKSRPVGLRRLKKITLVDEAQGRMHDVDMFGVDDLEDSVAPTTATTTDVDDELTLANTLIAIKAAKPKVISTAITTPRAKGIVFYEQVQAHIPTVSLSKDKGKAKMIELEKPLKKKVLLVYKVVDVFNKVNAAKLRVTTAVRVSTAEWIKWLEDQDMQVNEIF
nr:ribonuclease H-like domain-containing protein [Tanacetum cinerariifolium]